MAAVTCNHKRAVPKNFEEALQKKKELLEQIRGAHGSTEKQEARRREREEKAALQLQLQIETKDYNLGTSLRNYIDPRVLKSWCDHAVLDLTALYTKTLQSKFQWVTKAAPPWSSYAKASARAETGAAK
jgi:DNA topoisomerase-1